MTIIKTVSVASTSHMDSLARYLDDGRAIARGSQNLLDENRWKQEMEVTRKAYGHDVPARAGAKNTVAYHQCISFLPEEASVNGGKMSPAACMAFVREWVEERYPNQEAYWVLHEEISREDGVHRFCAHLCINRTDLSTGKRLDEGLSKHAKFERANAMRDMDKRWELKQTRANERNSLLHARCSSREERRLSARGIVTDKEYIRRAIRDSARQVTEVPNEKKAIAFSKELEKRGVCVERSKNGKDFTFTRAKTGRRVNGVKLGRGFTPAGLRAALRISVSLVQSVERSMETGIE